MIERDLQKKLLSELNSIDKCFAFSFNASGHSIRGMPDVILLKYPGNVIFIELKRNSKQKLKELQEHRRRQLQDLGFDHRVVKDKQDIYDIVNEIKSGVLE